MELFYIFVSYSYNLIPMLLCVSGEPGNEAIIVIDSVIYIYGSKQTEGEVRASTNGTQMLDSQFMIEQCPRLCSHV